MTAVTQIKQKLNGRLGNMYKHIIVFGAIFVVWITVFMAATWFWLRLITDVGG